MGSQYNSSEIAARIRFLISTMRLSQAAFAKRIGLDPANMSKHLSGKLPVTKGLVNRIAVDLGVSKTWLLQGEGVPFARVSTQQPQETEMPEIDYTHAPAIAAGETPVYDIDVTAGCSELSQMFTADRVIGSVNLPSIRKGSAIVRVNGDSMEPEIADGAYIAIRPISDPSCIFWGQIYVIVLEDYRMVKHLRRHADPDMVILRSSNPQYDDIEINRSQIRQLYIVESILNYKSRC